MKRRTLILLAVPLTVVVGAAAFGFAAGNERKPAPEKPKSGQRRALQEACASKRTYEGLKSQIFDEAAAIRGADGARLDLLSGATVVRMTDPLLKTSSEELGVTVCSGRFVVELPPGAERDFGGRHRLEASIEYAAQRAADGSGLVYQLRGAEPIVYRLAAFGTLPLAAGPSIIDSLSEPVKVEPEGADPSPKATDKAEEATEPEKPAETEEPPEAKKPAAAKPKAKKPAKVAANKAENKKDTAKKAPPRKLAAKAKPAKKEAPKKAVAAKPAARKSSKKTVAGKAPVKKAAVKKAVAAKAPAKKTVTKKATVKKTVAKKTPPPAPARPKPVVKAAAARKPAPKRMAAANPCAAKPILAERLLCGSAALAAKDRRVTTLYISALDNADAETHAILRRTAANFLAYRNGCRTEACLSIAYDDRTAEIRDIMADMR